MHSLLPSLSASLLLLSALGASEPAVEDIQAVHRHGQTFLTWTDVAAGKAGAGYRYTVYRSDAPITQSNLSQAQLCMKGLLNNSATLFHADSWKDDRLNPDKPMSIIQQGAAPLPRWSGLAVITATKKGKTYYAVQATDENHRPKILIVPGLSATKDPVLEAPGSIQPILLGDSKSRSPYCQVRGTRNLPLFLRLHPMRGDAEPGLAGDYYSYFGRPNWAFRDGVPGIFSVRERRGWNSADDFLTLVSRDSAPQQGADGVVRTYSFGYACIPQGAAHKEPRAYPFTERRLRWMVDWAIKHYHVDPNRVYCGGSSMGGWGTATFSLRHADLFAAVFPKLPIWRQRGLNTMVELDREAKIFMEDGHTAYYERMDMVKFVSEHPEDLPFIGWCIGRKDGRGPLWKGQVDMIKALTQGKHGFAFAWNNGGHSEGGDCFYHITTQYPQTRFALNRSYPAFGNSSINEDPGHGDPKEGDLVGGINLGFVWTDPVDEPKKWSIRLSNTRAQEPMTVDVTPRRCQRFKARPGESFRWQWASVDDGKKGKNGIVTADRNGLVTIERVPIGLGKVTLLTIEPFKLIGQVPPPISKGTEIQKRTAGKKKNAQRPSVVVRKVSSPPVMDGRIEELYAKQAQAMPFRFLHGLPGTPANTTTAWVVRDQENLYVAVRCGCMDPARVVADKTKHDDNVWSDEDIEIFIDPLNARKKQYAQIIINAKGVTEDTYRGKGGRSWNPALTVKTMKEEKAWTVEIKIPFKALGLEADALGKTWAFNITRSVRHPEDPGTLEDLAWSPTFSTSPHYPEAFGNLQLEDMEPSEEK